MDLIPSNIDNPRIREMLRSLDNANMYVAKTIGDGVYDNTSVIQNAILAAYNAGGGDVLLGGGTLLTGPLTLYNNVKLIGVGKYATTLKLKDNSNNNVITTANFSSLTGKNWSTIVSEGKQSLVPKSFGVSRLTIDGNKANQTSMSSSGIKFFGADWVMRDVVVKNCAGAGVYTENGLGSSSSVLGVGLQFIIDGCRVHANEGSGMEFDGQTDSVVCNTNVYDNGIHGIHVMPGGGAGLKFNKCHVWGISHTYSWYLDADGIQIDGCVGEGGTGIVYVNGSSINIDGGWYFAGDTTIPRKGFVFGPNAFTCMIHTMCSSFEGGFLDFSAGAASASRIVINGYSSVTPTLVVGTPATSCIIHLRVRESGGTDQFYFVDPGLRLGAWTSNPDAAVNGYITVKDSTGTSRKVATIA